MKAIGISIFRIKYN